MGSPRRYVFTGGGTGGHVMPNLAMMREIREAEPGAILVYLGREEDRRFLDSWKDWESEIRYVSVAARPPVSPRRPYAAALFLLALTAGFLRSLWTLVKLKPHVVTATGGYASVPCVLAAAVLRRRIFLHEQNAIPGRANLFLSRFATAIGVSFAETIGVFPKGKAQLTGYPIRRRFTRCDREEARRELNIPPGHRVAFVCGGSQGARSINRACIEGLPYLLGQDEPITIVHSTGRYDTPGYHAWQDSRSRLSTVALTEEQRGRFIMRQFFDRVEVPYAACDVVVSRAGAGTIMELATLGIPSVLIPKGDARDTHQQVNAFTMKDCGAADVILERLYDTDAGTETRVHGDELGRHVRSLLSDEEKLDTMSHRAVDIVVTDAARQNSDAIRRLARRRPSVAPKHRQRLVGTVQDTEGETTELLFGVNTLGYRSSADVRLAQRARGVRAHIRRVGTTPQDTRFILVVRRGTVTCNGCQVDKEVRLNPGATIEIGDNSLVFNAAIRVIEDDSPTSGTFNRVAASGMGTLASRLFGLGREVVLATSFGLGRVMDIFAASLTGANFLRRVFAENAVDSAFLPTYMTLEKSGRSTEARQLFRGVFWSVLAATCLVTVAGVATAGTWVPWLVPGFADSAKGGMVADTIALTQVMLPYLVLISAAAVLGALLKAHNRFGVTAWSSIMFSIGVVIGALCVPRFGLLALGWGVVAGGAGQLGIHLIAVTRRSFRRESQFTLQPCLAWGNQGMRKVRATAPKIVADVGISKVATVVDIVIVSSLAIGHTSVLYFSMLIFQLPFALISQSINTVALRDFSEGVASRDARRCRRLVASGVNWNVFLLLPASALMIVLARPIVDLLLSYHSFSASDADNVAIALRCYSIGLVGWGLQGLLGRLYAARLEMGQATVINIGAVLLNVGLSVLFVRMGYGFSGVAMGTSYAFLANGAFRLWHMNRNLRRDRAGAITLGDVAPSFLRAAAATGVATVVAFLAFQAVDGFAALPVFFSRLFIFMVPSFFGVFAFGAAATLLHSPEMDDILARLHRILPRAPEGHVDASQVNVYCVSPNKLLRLAKESPDTIRNASPNQRIQDLLNRADWRHRNIGVKLIGLLGITALSGKLVSILTNRTPSSLLHRCLGDPFQERAFVRRNAAHALGRLKKHDEAIEEALLLGLGDPYYEVRAASAHALAGIAEFLSPEGRVAAYDRMVELAHERNFEVAAAAIRGLPAVALDRAILDELKTFHYHPNWKIRLAVVEAYNKLEWRDISEDVDLVLKRLDDVLVTGEDFDPTFPLKHRLSLTVERLTKARSDTKSEPGRDGKTEEREEGA